MGIINVNGEADGMYSADMIELRITFEDESYFKSDVMKQVLMGCENFPKRIKESGIPMDTLDIDNDRMTLNVKDDKTVYKCRRNIKFLLPAKMELANVFVKLLQLIDDKVSYHLDYKITDKSKIQKELLAKAFEDSKNKAEMIADLSGLKIVGIEKIDTGDRYASGELAKSVVISDEYNIEALLQGYDPLNTETSDFLNVPKYYKRESISVQWKVE